MIIYHNNSKDVMISSWHVRFQAQFAGFDFHARKMFKLFIGIFFVRKNLNIGKVHTWTLNWTSERRISFGYWVTMFAQKGYTTTLYHRFMKIYNIDGQGCLWGEWRFFKLVINKFATSKGSRVTFATRNEWYFELITGNLAKCDGQPEKRDASTIFEI